MFSIHKVVITGVGAITPAGCGVPALWDTLRAHTPSIRAMTRLDPELFGVYVAGEVPDFQAENYMERKEARRMDRFCRYAIAAAQEAVQDAGIDFDASDRTRCGVLVGSGVGGLETLEAEYDKLRAGGPARVNPLVVPMIIGNMASGHIAIRYGLRGECTAVVTACASGANAIGEAFRLIRNGQADVMLAGGAEAPITALSVAGFEKLGALSTSKDPLSASIPFDARRNGFVIAEGAGIVVLESLEHARARGARILCELAGYGATGDGYHMTAPHPEGEGAARAMKLAMEEAEAPAETIGYINAHGTSTPPNDAAETKAIRAALGAAADTVAVSSTKSAIGHLLGAAGAVEAILCALAIRDAWVPPTLGYAQPDPACDLDYVPNVGRDLAIDVALSNSLGFGGHNATLAFRRYLAQ